MKLIDKAAVIAEIERRKNQFVSQAESFRKIGKENKESYFATLASNMNSLSCFIDTLEVEEVNADYWYQKFLKEKEQKDKLEELGQAMYDRMQNLTTDCTGIRAAMDKWWCYINKLNKED